MGYYFDIFDLRSCDLSVTGLMTVVEKKCILIIPTGTTSIIIIIIIIIIIKSYIWKYFSISLLIFQTVVAARLNRISKTKQTCTQMPLVSCKFTQLFKKFFNLLSTTYTYNCR